MTIAYQTPAPLAAYLRRATYGLPKDRREEVWNELEEHILSRAEQLEFQGYSAQAALAQALREMGPPLRVSLGMNGVHNMPKLIAFGTLGMLAVSAGFYALAEKSGPTLEVNVQTKGSAVNCVKVEATQPNQPFLFQTSGWNCYQDDSSPQDGIYMSVSEIKKTLHPLGFRVDLKDGLITFYYEPLKKRVAQTNINFKQGDEAYLDASNMLSMAMGGFPINTYLHDYDHPTISVGNLSNLVLTGQS